MLMTIEKALEELKKYAKEFTEVGDAKQAIKNDKDGFLHKFIKVNQYYKYIIRNVKDVNDEFFAAVNIVGDISFNNPSLDEYVNIIIGVDSKNNQKQSQNIESVDTDRIYGIIESLVTEVKNMVYWDPNEIGDIEWQLQKYQKILMENQSSFDPNVYQSLMDDIDAALGKIGKFNDMVNSDAMESIRKM